MNKLAPLFLIACFSLNSVHPAIAADAFGTGTALALPRPGTMVNVSPVFAAPFLRGIKVHRDDPFRFDFVLDQGDTKTPTSQAEAAKLVKYFLASVTTPTGDLWVNLSPYEKDRIVPQGFGQTEMGRDLLAQDYILKQLTASIIYPESKTGKEFWAQVYGQAAKRFGTTQVPINTFNKVWIVPATAEVYENAASDTAYVVKSSLKVLLEGDYLALHKAHKPAGGHDSQKLGTDVVREVVIPLLTKEVNEGQNFAVIRQVYNSLILATWYKNKLKDSVISLGYANQNKTAGINFKDAQTKEIIYQQYLEAFKAGAYNYIKEETDLITKQTIPRKYFSGGASFAMVANVLKVMGLKGDALAKLKPSTVLEWVQVQLTFSGSYPALAKMTKAAKVENPRKVLTRLAMAVAVASMAASSDMTPQVAALAPMTTVEQGQLTQKIVITAASLNIQSELEDIVLNKKISDREKAEALVAFFKKNGAERTRIKAETERLYRALTNNPKADVLTIYQGKQELAPAEIDTSKNSYIGTFYRDQIADLLKAQGYGEIAPSVAEMVQYIAAKPLEMAIWQSQQAGTSMFKDRKVYFIRMSSETMSDPTKLNVALEEAKKHPLLQGKSVIAAWSPNVLEAQNPQIVEIFGAKPKVVVIGAVVRFIDETRATVTSLVKPKDRLFPRDIKEQILKYVGHVEEDTASHGRVLEGIYQQLKKNPNIKKIGMVFADEGTEIKQQPEFLINARKKWDFYEKVVDMIFTSPSGKNYGDKEAYLKQETLKMVRYSMMDPLEVVAMLHPEIFQKTTFFTIPVRITDEQSKNSKDMLQTTFDVGTMLALGVIKPSDIQFLNELNKVATIQELDRNQARYEIALAALVSKIKTSPKFKEDERLSMYTKGLEDRIRKQRNSILFSRLIGQQVQTVIGPLVKNQEGDLMVLASGQVTDGFDEKIAGVDVVKDFVVQDNAMANANKVNRIDPVGGIDLNALDLNLRSNGPNIKFNLSPELLEKTKNAPGLTPVILNILPLTNLKEFLR